MELNIGKMTNHPPSPEYCSINKKYKKDSEIQLKKKQSRLE